MQASATPNAHPQLEAAISHLANLIAYNTTSAYSNLELIHHMESFFASLGAEVTVLPDEPAWDPPTYLASSSRAIPMWYPPTQKAGKAILSKWSSAAVACLVVAPAI